MDKVSLFFLKNNGYARMHDLKSAGLHTREVASAVQQGIIEKFAPGWYKLSNYNWDEFSSFTDLTVVRRDTVICLESAAEYHGLTTYNPPVVTAAIPRGTRKFSLIYPPVRIHFFSQDQYKTGILKAQGNSGEFSVYSMEKTIVDLFRYRNKTGYDLILETLRSYLNRKDRNINLLTEYAKQFRIYNEIFSYIQAMMV